MFHQSKTIKNIDWPVFGFSAASLILFIVIALIDIDALSRYVTQGFNFSCKNFGAYWQVLLLLQFLIAMGLAISPLGKIKLGQLDKPELSTFKWIAIIMCTLLAGGGIFWSAAEPIFHFTKVPPSYPEIASSTRDAVVPALTQSYFHWGFSAWSILGSLGTIVLMYTHYHCKLPLKPRALLFPVFGKKIFNHWLGTVADSSSVIAAIAGTVGPIGFLGLQLGNALESLWGVPDTYTTHLLIILGLVCIYTVSAISGVHRGIQYLSTFNVLLAVFLVCCIMLLGPSAFIVDSFLSSMGHYVQDFFRLSLNRRDENWLGWWTIFFWAWWIGFAPLMTIFMARISRGRTVREIVVAVSIIAPIVSNFWFTVLGGSGIFFELQNPGIISDPLNNTGLQAAMLAIINQFPYNWLFIPAFLVLLVVFLATTGDSMAYTISMAITGDNTPSRIIRAFWALMMGTMAAILLSIGEGGIKALQSMIVITAVPVGFLFTPLLWTTPKILKELGAET